MAKEFKTFAQLIELLESRGVATDATTVDCLRRESYYAVINGYKGPFLDKNAAQSSSDDVFREGTSFKNIYDLFLFDRELRQLIFSYLARAEAVRKNAVVYSFSMNTVLQMPTWIVLIMLRLVICSCLRRFEAIRVTSTRRILLNC